MKILKIQLYSLLILCFVSCESYVEVDLPDSQLTSSTVFVDKNTANAAMTEIYTKLRESGFLSGGLQGSSSALGMYADELTYYGSPGVSGQFLFANNLLPSSEIVTTQWNESYHQIYLANSVLIGVQNSTGLAQEDKDQLRGEALFVRALIHLYLVNVYGDVPYITTTDYQQNRLAIRTPTADVYTNITADLIESADLLPSNYLTANRTRPNRSAARAVLARTYLYRGLWAEAANEASSVITNSLYSIEPNLELVFLKESGETIWQFAPMMNGMNTREASAFTFTTVPPPTVAISTQLLNSFELGDIRLEQWLKPITDGSDTYYHAYKYKTVGNSGTSVEYSIVLRLAEQYLIRAEARARQGDIIGSREDLNTIRQRAGLEQTTAVSEEELINAVLHERQLELFTEHGHRFFDLKRTNRLDSALTPVKFGWDTTDKLWPIPETELLANPNLTPQNSGY